MSKSNLKVGDKIKFLDIKSCEEADLLEKGSVSCAGATYQMLNFFGKEGIVRHVGDMGNFKIENDHSDWWFSPCWLEKRIPKKVKIGELV